MAAPSRALDKGQIDTHASRLVRFRSWEVLDLVDDWRQRQTPSELRLARAKALAEDQSSRPLQRT